MEFEWDDQKAAVNLKKHGVSFEEASTVFRDPFAATGADPDHSFGEHRWVTLGISDRGRLLVVAHAERYNCIRIISARPVTKVEQKIYERA
jgi:uncharacterized DUF497 family protein